MRNFEWCEPASLEQALIDLGVAGALVKAGGVDLYFILDGNVIVLPDTMKVPRPM